MPLGAALGPPSDSLDAKTKDGDHTVHRLAIPPCCTASVGLVIPEARTRRVHACAILLHDNASHNVFEGLLQLRQLFYDALHNIRSPLWNLAVRVQSRRQCRLYRLIDVLFDLFL